VWHLASVVVWAIHNVSMPGMCKLARKVNMYLRKMPCWDQRWMELAH
jgi:hypothetical protein